jgi:hypothetical protein
MRHFFPLAARRSLLAVLSIRHSPLLACSPQGRSGIATRKFLSSQWRGAKVCVSSERERAAGGGLLGGRLLVWGSDWLAFGNEPRPITAPALSEIRVGQSQRK